MAIPSLLAVSALEQHLVREKKRTAVSVLLESGEPRDVHQLAALIAFGARAVCPYLAHECIKSLCEKEASVQKYNQALTAGVQKIASKMGVSTLQAYQSAQLFEALGLDVPLVENYFTNTPHQLGGIGLEHIEADLRWHHQRAYQSTSDPMLDSVGVHRLRKRETAEEHLYTPQAIHTLQQAVWTNSEELFDKYAEMIESDGPRAIRSLLDFRFECCTPVPLEEVEPVEQIVRRFKTGAMSYGSISREAHECMAIAMNRLGGRSNSGEGGEWPERFGTELNSAVKQVAKEHGASKNKLYQEALEKLKERYALAVVSNKPDSAVKSLCADYFPGIHTRGERADCPRKPAPDMVRRTMAEIGVDKCIYVGDSEVDVLTAKNAGVPCLSVLWGFRDREEIEAAGGKNFCETTAQLAEKIEEMING